MKKLIAAFFGILLILGGLIAAPAFIDWSRYKEQIVTQLQLATGFQYEIGGDLDLSLLPLPRLVIGDLKITNPAAGKEPLLTLKQAEVSVALVPLFSKRVEVNSILLDGPVIRLETDAKGIQNWMTTELQARMKAQAPATGGANIGQAVTLKEVSVQDGVFSYADHRNGKSYKVSDMNFSVKGDTLLGPYKAEGVLLYADQAVEFEVTSGRIESGAKSIALQGTASSGAFETKLTFSGVLAFGEKPEIQGETSIDTKSLANLVKMSGSKSTQPWMAQPLSLRGLLTASALKADYKNMQVTFGNIAGSGNFSLLMPQPNKKMALDLTLNAAKPVDLDALLPPDKQSEKKQKASLPDAVTLPADITAKASISAPAVTYKGTTLNTVKLLAERSDKETKIGVNGILPDKGTLDASLAVIFGSSSRAEKTGAITLSDPSITYVIGFSSSDSAKTLQPFLPAAAAPFVSGPVSLNASGAIRPGLVTIEESVLSAHDTKIAASGSYADSKEGRDALKLVASTDKIDLDAWLKKLPAKNKAPAKGQEEAVRKFVQTLALPYDLDLSLAMKNVRLKGSDYAALNVLAQLQGQKLAVRTLEVKDATGNGLIVAGTAGNIGELQDLDFSVQANTQDAKSLLSGFGMATERIPAGLKKAELISEFKGQADDLDFTANLKAMGGSLEIAGGLSDVLKTPVLSDLTVRAKHSNYVDIARMFNPDFSSSVAIRKDLDFFASMKREEKKYTFSDLQATIGPATFSGKIVIDTAGAKPAVDASLQAGDFPIHELLGHNVRSANRAAQKSNRTQDVRWSRTPFNVDWLHKFDMKLSGSAKSLAYGPWVFSNATLAATLKDGTLTLEKAEGGMHGGKASVTGKASSAAPGQPLSAEGKADLKDISLESFVAAFSGSPLVKARGTISLETSVAATGASPATLIFDLHGDGKASGSNLVFEGFDLARLSRTLAQPSSSMKENLGSLLNTTMKGGATSFDTLNAAYTINQGVVTFSELLLKGPDATVTSTGNINLPLWTIDLNNSISLTEPADAPALEVAFKGPLDNPGKAFGKSALDSYVNKMIGDAVKDAIGDKLQDSGILEKLPILPGVLSPTKKAVPAPAPVTTEQVPAPVPAQESDSEPAAEPAAGEAAPVTQPAQEQPAAEKEPVQQVTPEALFKGVLEDVLEGQ